MLLGRLAASVIMGTCTVGVGVADRRLSGQSQRQQAQQLRIDHRACNRQLAGPIELQAGALATCGACIIQKPVTVPGTMAAQKKGSRKRARPAEAEPHNQEPTEFELKRQQL